MGMFDYVIVMNDTRFSCSYGHVQSEFQTKDLDCSMARYYLRDDGLYEASRDVSESIENTDTGFYLVSKSLLKPTTHTVGLRMYSQCDACVPVLYLRQSSSFVDCVDERYPWIEFMVVFKSGKLTDITRIKTDTRESLRNELKSSGVVVLDDDNPVAQRHFFLLNNKTNKW